MTAKSFGAPWAGGMVRPLAERAWGSYLLWVGIMHGLVDALLLSVLPVVATWRAVTILGWSSHRWGKVLVSIIAVLLSFIPLITLQDEGTARYGATACVVVTILVAVIWACRLLTAASGAYGPDAKN